MNMFFYNINFYLSYYPVSKIAKKTKYSAMLSKIHSYRLLF